MQGASCKGQVVLCVPVYKSLSKTPLVFSPKRVSSRHKAQHMEMVLFGIATAAFVGFWASVKALIAQREAHKNCDACSIFEAHKRFTALLFGVSNAWFGLLYYLGMLGASLAALVMQLPDFTVLVLEESIFWFSAFGAGISLILLGIQAFVIRQFCWMCILSALASFLIFGLALVGGYMAHGLVLSLVGL